MAAGDFFEFKDRLSQAARPPVSAPREADALTVTQLTARIDKSLKSAFPKSLLVRGEISNYKLHGVSGHQYFTLKDASSCIDCVMWKSDAIRLRFEPNDGMEVLASGRLSAYGARGRYQLYVGSLQPLGQGALELAFKQLQTKLEAEGLFSPDRKRPIPLYPMQIALVTSQETAALQDMLKVLTRFPWIKKRIYHVPVQGQGAAERIASALEDLNRRQAVGPSIADVILLGRGGGSLEDLWAFNEEIVARAIVKSRIPIITGIGHEVDVSIADLAADYHAHTPTEAAQIAIGGWKGVAEALDAASMRLQRGLRVAISDARQRLIAVERHEWFRRPIDRIRQSRQILDDRLRSLSLAMSRHLASAKSQLNERNLRLDQHHPRHRIALERQRIGLLETRGRRAIDSDLHRRLNTTEAMAAHLHAIGPEQVLRRGYSMTTIKKSGTLVRSPADVKPGERIVTRLTDGQIESTVEDPRQGSLF